MEPLYAYPGTFGPPHRGHAAIAVRAAALFPNLTIICSKNPEKDNQWFSPDETKTLWSTYDLPANVRVITLDEFRAEKNDPSRIVMVRGLRGPEDVAYEAKVLVYNKEHYGIDHFFYLFSEPALRALSSSDLRRAAAELDLPHLGEGASPLDASALLEKALGLASLHFVVGPPGAGKSTVLKALVGLDAAYCPVNTDHFLDDLKPRIAEHFGSNDLVKVAIQHSEELKAFVAPIFLERLMRSLRAAPQAARIIVEVAYGLMPDKAMYRWLGGKVIYIGCADNAENRRRLLDRGTPEHLPFLDTIPGLAESLAIAKEKKLKLVSVDTRRNIEDAARQLDRLIKEQGT